MTRRKPSTTIWRTLRTAALLYVLAMVALGAWLAKARSTDWNGPLYMAVYPVNGDGSDAAADYLRGLDAASFEAVEAFLSREARRYGLPLDEPLLIELGSSDTGKPPAPPVARHPLAVIWWSLKMRYHAWSAARAQDLPAPDIRMFVVYHDPDAHPRLAHSLGLAKGLIGVVNAYGGRRHSARNNVVIAHELLHTLGATDKYDPATNQPLFPGGYAEPERSPLYPQRRAEIMGGRIALTPSTAEMPDGLEQALIGADTAAEIRWPAAKANTGG